MEFEWDDDKANSNEQKMGCRSQKPKLCSLTRWH